MRKVTRYPYFFAVLLFFIVFLSRIPLLKFGFGLDPDVYRIVAAGKHFSSTCSYLCRRPPCHPVPVISYALLHPTTSFLFNSITALLSAVGAVVFALSLRYLGGKTSFLAGLAFAFVPVVYINSTNSMDYMWALGFALVSVFFAVRGKTILSGVMMGFSAGCRLEYLALALPITTMILIGVRLKDSWKDAVKYIFSTGLATLFVFSPVLYKYGPKIITNKFRITYSEPFEKVLDKATFEIFGGVGIASLLVMVFGALVLALFSKKTRNGWFKYSRNIKGWLILCLASVAIFAAGFLRAPFEAGYLVSIIPFVIGFFSILLDVSKPAKAILIAGLGLLLSSPFVLSASLTNKSLAPENSIELPNSSLFITYDLKGPLLLYKEELEEAQTRCSKIIEKISTVAKRHSSYVVIVAGSMAPRLREEWSSELGKNVKITELIKSERQIQKYKDEDSRIYYLGGVLSYNKSSYGIDLRKHGAKLLR